MGIFPYQYIMVVTRFSSYYEKFADRTTVCIDDEIPFDVPKGWEWVRLNDIATIVGGYAYKSYDFLSSSPYQVLRLGNIKNDFLKLDASPVYISDDLAIKTDKFRCYLDDILITMTGTRKKRDYFFSYKVESINQNCFINQRVGAIRFYIKEISNYMIHALKAESILQDVFQYETGTANQGNLGSENIAKVLIPLPPLAEQHRIAEKIQKLLPIVEQYDSAQSKLDSLNSNINELLKKSILQEAIQGKLVPQDPNDEPASALLQRIKEEKLRLFNDEKLKKKDVVDSIIFRGDDNKYYEQIDGEVVDITEDIPFDVPEGWSWCRLKSICTIFTGATFKKEDARTDKQGIRILRGGNILPFEIAFKVDDIFLPCNYVKENILLQKNDIITPAVTSLENIGKMARVKDDLPDVTVGGFVFVLRLYCSNDWLSQYLLALMSSPTIIEYMKSITNKSGQAFYNIGKERLVTTLLPIPPLVEQQRIVTQIEKIFNEIKD